MEAAAYIMNSCISHGIPHTSYYNPPTQSVTALSNMGSMGAPFALDIEELDLRRWS